MCCGRDRTWQHQSYEQKFQKQLLINRVCVAQNVFHPVTSGDIITLGGSQGLQPGNRLELGVWSLYEKFVWKFDASLESVADAETQDSLYT